MRVLFLTVMLMVLFGCKSTRETSDAESAASELDLQVWYILEVGGRPETGQAHHYILTGLKHCTADSLHFEDVSIPIKENPKDGTRMAYRHFKSGESVPNGLLSAVVHVSCDDKKWMVPLDSIYLKERIILP